MLIQPDCQNLYFSLPSLSHVSQTLALVNILYEINSFISLKQACALYFLWEVFQSRDLLKKSPLIL